MAHSKSGNLWLLCSALAFFITTSIQISDKGEVDKPHCKMPEMVVFEIVENQTNIQVRPYSHTLHRLSQLNFSTKRTLFKKYSPFLPKWASRSEQWFTEKAPITKPIAVSATKWAPLSLPKKDEILIRTTRSHSSQMLKPTANGLPRPNHTTSSLNTDLSEMKTSKDHPLGRSAGSNPPITIEVTPSDETLITVYFVSISQDLAILVNLPPPNNTTGEFAILITLTAGTLSITYSGTITFISPGSNSTVGFEIPPSSNGAVITVDVPQGMTAPTTNGRKTKIRLVHLANSDTESMTSMATPRYDDPSTSTPSFDNFDSATVETTLGASKPPNTEYSTLFLNFMDTTSFERSSTSPTTHIPQVTSSARSPTSRTTSLTAPTIGVIQSSSPSTSRYTTTDLLTVATPTRTPGTLPPSPTTTSTFTTWWGRTIGERMAPSSSTEAQHSSLSTSSTQNVTNPENGTHITITTLHPLQDHSQATTEHRTTEYTFKPPVREITETYATSSLSTVLLDATSTTASQGSMTTMGQTEMTDATGPSPTMSLPGSRNLSESNTTSTTAGTTAVKTTAHSIEAGDLATLLEPTQGSTTAAITVSAVHSKTSEYASTDQFKTTKVSTVTSVATASMTQSLPIETTASAGLTTINATLASTTVKPSKTSVISTLPAYDLQKTNETTTYPGQSSESTFRSTTEMSRTTSFTQLSITTERHASVSTKPTTTMTVLMDSTKNLSTTAMPTASSLATEIPSTMTILPFISKKTSISPETTLKAEITASPKATNGNSITSSLVTTMPSTSTSMPELSSTTEVSKDTPTTVTALELTAASVFDTITTNMPTIIEKPATMSTVRDQTITMDNVISTTSALTTEKTTITTTMQELFSTAKATEDTPTTVTALERTVASVLTTTLTTDMATIIEKSATVSTVKDQTTILDNAISTTSASTTEKPTITTTVQELSSTTKATEDTPTTVTALERTVASVLTTTLTTDMPTIIEKSATVSIVKDQTTILDNVISTTSTSMTEKPTITTTMQELSSTAKATEDTPTTVTALERTVASVLTTTLTTDMPTIIEKSATVSTVRDQTTILDNVISTTSASMTTTMQELSSTTEVSKDTPTTVTALEITVASVFNTTLTTDMPIIIEKPATVSTVRDQTTILDNVISTTSASTTEKLTTTTTMQELSSKTEVSKDTPTTVTALELTVASVLATTPTTDMSTIIEKHSTMSTIRDQTTILDNVISTTSAFMTEKPTITTTMQELSSTAKATEDTPTTMTTLELTLASVHTTTLTTDMPTIIEKPTTVSTVRDQTTIQDNAISTTSASTTEKPTITTTVQELSSTTKATEDTPTTVTALELTVASVFATTPTTDMSTITEQPSTMSTFRDQTITMDNVISTTSSASTTEKTSTTTFSEQTMIPMSTTTVNAEVPIIISEKPNLMSTVTAQTIPVTTAISITEVDSESMTVEPATIKFTTMLPKVLNETATSPTREEPEITTVSRLTNPTGTTSTGTTEVPSTVLNTSTFVPTTITTTIRTSTEMPKTTAFSTRKTSTVGTEATFTTLTDATLNTTAASPRTEPFPVSTTVSVAIAITPTDPTALPSTVSSTVLNKTPLQPTAAAGCPTSMSSSSVPITAFANTQNSALHPVSSTTNPSAMGTTFMPSKRHTQVGTRPLYSTTGIPRTRTVPATYWLRTVIEVKAEEVNESFIIDMRLDLQVAYEKAFLQQQQNSFYGLIVKRWASEQVLQIDVEMINVTAHPSLKQAEMVYYLTSRGNLIPVKPAVKAMETLDDQEAAIIFGHVMVIKAEPYLQDPTNVPYTNEEHSVILPAVLGSVAALLLLILIAIIIYYCVCRQKLSESTSSLTIGQRNRQTAFEEDVTSSVLTLGPGAGIKSESGNVWTSSQTGVGSMSHSVQTSPPEIPKRTKRTLTRRPLPNIPGDTDYANINIASSIEKLVEDVPVPSKRRSLSKRAPSNLYRSTTGKDYDFDKTPKTGGIFDHLKPPVSKTPIVKVPSTVITIYPDALLEEPDGICTLSRPRERLSKATALDEQVERIPAATQTEELASHSTHLERSISHPTSAPEFEGIQAEIQINTMRQRMQEVLDEAFSFWRNMKLSPRFQRRLEPGSSYMYTPKEATTKSRKTEASSPLKQRYSSRDSVGRSQAIFMPSNTRVPEVNENVHRAQQDHSEPWSFPMSSHRPSHSSDLQDYSVTVSPSGTPHRGQPYASPASIQTTSLIGSQLAAKKGPKTITPVNGENEIDFVNCIRVSKDPETQFLIRTIKEELQKFRTSYNNVDYAIV